MTTLDALKFNTAFERFQEIIQAASGHPFRGFEEGIAAAWEGYKPRLREHALSVLAADRWTGAMVGSGAILDGAIAAIEIDDRRANLTNNLVLWQNRWGHANRDHHGLLDARDSPRDRERLEQLLFELFSGSGNEAGIFDAIAAVTERRYPLLAYLFFLRDSSRFMPIRSTPFDRAFKELGIALVTVSNCSWDNYSKFNDALMAIRGALANVTGIGPARLIDSHSFCWLLERLPRAQEGKSKPGAPSAGRVLGAPERSVAAMRMSIEQTTRSSNGQLALHTVKNKELLLSSMQLEKLLAHLLEKQGNRCALTGIPFQFHGTGGDKALLPSPDRIDSNGHYDAGNLQVVCQFVNFWKGSSDNAEFKRLLALVRTAGEGE